MRLILIVLLALPALALAQDDDETWLGAGLYARPKFDGSSERWLEPIPVVRYYGSPWFARTVQGMLEGGARWKVGKDVAAGAQLAYEDGPLGHHPGASVGAHVEADRTLGPAPLNLLMRLPQFLDNGRGRQLDLRLTIGVYEGHGFTAGLFAQATWASEKSLEAYYAVRDSGLLFSCLGSFGGFTLTRLLRLLARAAHTRLTSTDTYTP